MLKVGDRAVIKSYFLGRNGFASGEIVRIAKRPTMYKIKIDNPIHNHPGYEWAFEKELSHMVTICS